MKKNEVIKTEYRKSDDEKWLYIYLSVLASISLGTVHFLMIKVVPTFADVFSSFGASLPWPTRIVIEISELLRNPLGFFSGFFISGLIGVLIYLKLNKAPQEQNMKFILTGLSACTVLGGLTVGFIIFAMFWPMFEIGK